MTRDERFFYNNAGYSWGQGETAMQGRERRAKALAAAEKHAREHDWAFEWNIDELGCSGCDCKSTDCPCSTGEPHETLYCVLWTTGERNEIIASLGGICKLTDKYKRVVEAELASEALHNERLLSIVCAE